MGNKEHGIHSFSLAILCLGIVFFMINIGQAVIAYANRPQPQIVQIDSELEKVYAELGPRLHGINDRKLPAKEAREVVEALVASSREHGFSPWFIVAIIEVESGANIDAVSPTGARGLMQIIPGTFAGVSQHHSISNPVENVRAGVAYLAKLYKGGKGFVRFDSILRAYNGGPKTAMVYSNAVKAGIDPLTVASNEVHDYPGRVRAKYKALVKTQGGNIKNIDKLWRAVA